MSTATTEVPTEKKSPSARKEFTQGLISKHREIHGIAPVERLSNEHYEDLGKVVAEQHDIDVPKAVAYVKSIDSQTRSPQKAHNPVPNVDADELLAVRGAPEGASWREYITDLRTNAGMNKNDIIKQVYDDRKSEVDSGALAASSITAMVNTALKGIAAARKAEPRGDTIPLGDLVLGKYDELRNKYGDAAVDDTNLVTGEAEREFCQWYEQIRGSAVGKVERTGDRMAAHAMWDLKRRLIAKGIYVRAIRAPKPAPEQGPAPSEA